MWEQIAEGGPLDLGGMQQYEYLIPEGSRGLLQLNLRLPVSQGVAQELEDRLKAVGVEGVKVTTASPVLRIYFTKGFPWLIVIVGIIIAMIALAILIVSWQLFREVGPGSTSLLLLAGLGVVAIAGIILLKTRRAT